MQLHAQMCATLAALVKRMLAIGHSLDSERGRFRKAGIQALCTLQLALDKARSLLQYCSDSSKLYLVCLSYCLGNHVISCSYRGFCSLRIHSLPSHLSNQVIGITALTSKPALKSSTFSLCFSVVWILRVLNLQLMFYAGHQRRIHVDAV